MKLIKTLITLTAVLLSSITIANATNIAIVQGEYYTPDLKNNLLAQGQTVAEISTYTAASLAGYDAVIHYGNSFTNTAALENYVNAGGNLILTPWAGLNFSVPSTLQIFNDGGNAIFSAAYPGVNVLSPGHSLLTGVSFPLSPGAFNVGRISGIDFVAGVNGIVDWADGVGMLGLKSFGLGNVIGLNMQVITSDTAYQVINQAWATQLVVNAANYGGNVVPEPAVLGLMGLGFVALGISRRRVTVKRDQA